MIKRTIVTTLPTTLTEGEEVYYRDSNGVQTLWVGNAQGEAWPSVGYKEYVATISQLTTGAPIPTIISDTIGYNRVYARQDKGGYTVQKQSTEILFPQKTIFTQLIPVDEDNTSVFMKLQSSTLVDIFTRAEGTHNDGVLEDFLIQFRIYP